MDRRDFFKKTLLGIGVIGTAKLSHSQVPTPPIGEEKTAFSTPTITTDIPPLGLYVGTIVEARMKCSQLGRYYLLLGWQIHNPNTPNRIYQAVALETPYYAKKTFKALGVSLSETTCKPTEELLGITALLRHQQTSSGYSRIVAVKRLY